MWREDNRRTQRKTLVARTRTNNKLNPHITRGRNRIRATLPGGEHSHHCAIPAPPSRITSKNNRRPRFGIAWLTSSESHRILKLLERFQQMSQYFRQCSSIHGLQWLSYFLRSTQITVQKENCDGLSQSCPQPPETEYRTKDCECRTVSCKWEEWSSWSTSCGNGTRMRGILGNI